MADRMGLSNHHMSFSKSTDDLSCSPAYASRSSISMAFQRRTKEARSGTTYIKVAEQAVGEAPKPSVKNTKSSRMANITLTQPIPFRIFDNRARTQHYQSMGNLYQAASASTLGKASPPTTRAASTQTDFHHQQKVTSQAVATQTDRPTTESEEQKPERSDAIPLGSADKSLGEMKLEEILSELKKSNLTKPLSDNVSAFTLESGSPIKITNPRRYLTHAYNQNAKSLLSDFIRRCSEEQTHADALKIRFHQLLHDTLADQRLDEAYKTKELVELTQQTTRADSQRKIESILEHGELRSLMTLLYMALQTCSKVARPHR